MARKKHINPKYLVHHPNFESQSSEVFSHLLLASTTPYRNFTIFHKTFRFPSSASILSWGLTYNSRPMGPLCIYVPFISATPIVNLIITASDGTRRITIMSVADHLFIISSFSSSLFPRSTSLAFDLPFFRLKRIHHINNMWRYEYITMPSHGISFH